LPFANFAPARMRASRAPCPFRQSVILPRNFSDAHRPLREPATHQSPRRLSKSIERHWTAQRRARQDGHRQRH
jgi:hypothetical protein